jgi:phosphoglucosamine mutase
VLINVRDVDKSRADTEPALLEAVDLASQELGADGRVLLRPSGTESVVRVMVEAQTASDARRIAEHLAGVVKTTLGPVGSASAG